MPEGILTAHETNTPSFKSRIVGISLLAVGLALLVGYALLRNQVPEGGFISMVNALFQSPSQTPGLEQQTMLRAAKLWQIMLLIPGCLLFAAGISLMLAYDSRRLVRRALNSLPTTAFLTICSLLYFGITLWVVYVPFEGVPHIGDDIAQVFQARILARWQLLAPAPSPDLLASFRPLHIVVQNGMWHGMYPIGHSLLMVPFVWVGLEMWSGAFLGVLRLLMLYALARLWLGQSTSRLAVILYVLSPLVYMISASPVYHNSDLLLALIFLWGFLRSRENRRALPALVAGLALGCSSTVRPTMPFILAASGLTFILWDWWKHGRRDALWRGCWMAVGAIPGILLFLWTNSVQNGSPLLLGYEVLYPGQSFGFGQNAGYIQLYGSQGHTPLKALYNLLGNILAMSTTLHGWILISLVPALLGLWAGRQRMANWLLASLCFYTAIIQAFHFGGSIILGPRHYFICVGGLLILGAQGLVWLWRCGRRMALATTLALIILTVQAAIVYVPDVVADLSASYLGVDGKVTRLANQEAQAPALVFVRGDIKAYYNTQSGFLANSPWLDNPIIYAQELSEEQNRKVMAQYPGRTAYVFVCKDYRDPGRLYPYGEAPPRQPGDIMEYSISAAPKILPN
jgi:hypothetical protein